MAAVLRRSACKATAGQRIRHQRGTGSNGNLPRFYVGYRPALLGNPLATASREPSASAGGSSSFPAPTRGSKTVRSLARENRGVMGDLPPGIQRVALDMMLGEIELRLVLDPDANDARFDQGCLLEALGRPDEAKRTYRELLRADPAHFGALNNLGILLFRGGFWRSAAMAYARAVARHPVQIPWGTPILPGCCRCKGRPTMRCGITTARSSWTPPIRRRTTGWPTFCSSVATRGRGDRGINGAGTRSPAGYRDVPNIAAVRRPGARCSGRLAPAGEGNIPADRYSRRWIRSVFLRSRRWIADFLRSQPRRCRVPPRRRSTSSGDADRCAEALVAATAILAASGKRRSLNPLHRTVLVTGRGLRTRSAWRRWRG